ncbi:hypothetical protein GIB67_031730 [Kingdonia uniflora]|uniref:Uncharacterized protein n=1 Tax=Kingdonia uniflora TaxID=39325 RepID=A0A7J7NJX4_9MAGN|nr:hypothetical protein GIB67_031730 [Kingdonia uniflora]
MESNKELTASNKLMTKPIEVMLVMVMAIPARVVLSDVVGDDVEGSGGGSTRGRGKGVPLDNDIDLNNLDVNSAIIEKKGLETSSSRYLLCPDNDNDTDTGVGVRHGSTIGNPGKAGLGVMTRTHTCEVLGVRIKGLGVINSFDFDCSAILEALSWATEKDIEEENIDKFVDSREVEGYVDSQGRRRMSPNPSDKPTIGDGLEAPQEGKKRHGCGRRRIGIQAGHAMIRAGYDKHETRQGGRGAGHARKWSRNTTTGRANGYGFHDRRGRGRNNTPNNFGTRSRTDNYQPNQDWLSRVDKMLGFKKCTGQRAVTLGVLDWLNRVDKMLGFKKFTGQRAVTLVEIKLTGGVTAPATVTTTPTSPTPAVGGKPARTLHDLVDEALEQLLSSEYGDAEVTTVDLSSP